MERDSVSFVSEYELKGKAENGCVDKPHVDRCVSVCDTGFWSNTVVLCFGPNYTCVCLTYTTLHTSQERERESDLEDLLSLSRRDEISQPNLACHEPLLHDTGKVDVACSRDMARAEREHWSAVQQQH